jgi:predicted nuclease with TOPRIM domain
LESEQAAMQETLENLQVENTELVQLLNLQALLIADTKRWLEEFEQRYSLIQTSFIRLTDHSLAT